VAPPDGLYLMKVDYLLSAVVPADDSPTTQNTYR
jgi:hypothetical protein